MTNHQAILKTSKINNKDNLNSTLPINLSIPQENSNQTSPRRVFDKVSTIIEYRRGNSSDNLSDIN